MSHWPVVSHDFDHLILVVRQAVYGWLPDWTAADATSAAGRSAILDDRCYASYFRLRTPPAGAPA